MDGGTRHHPFRTLRDPARAGAAPMHGIQAWVALPEEDEEVETELRSPRPQRPSPPTSFPGLWARLISGKGVRRRGEGQDPFADVLRPTGGWAPAPRRRSRPTIQSAPPSSPPVRSRSTGGRSAPARWAVLKPGDPVLVTGVETAEVMLLGRRAGRSRVFLEWNFVSLVAGANRPGQGGLARGDG